MVSSVLLATGLKLQSVNLPLLVKHSNIIEQLTYSAIIPFSAIEIVRKNMSVIDTA